MNRRQFLAASAAVTAAAGLPRRARAVSASDLKFLFVFNRGGWDPTRVFAAEFDNGAVDMEADAGRGTWGGLGLVDHADRPSVAAFFEGWHDRALVWNGVQVRSINHEICTLLAMTGSPSGTAADWPAILAAAQADRYALPHLVLGGASFPGDQGVAVARAGQAGQLEGLLSGEILDGADGSVGRPAAPDEGIVDRYLLRRTAARARAARGPGDAALAEALDAAANKAVALKDYRHVMSFAGGSALEDQAGVAVDALATGLSRCVTLGYPGDLSGLAWDSHANNDAQQSPLWEELFAGLNRLMALLAGTPGPAGGSLDEETVVVVLSEMGRTPQKNATDGKDHWPYTSMLWVGPGIDGDRVVGGYDDVYAGAPVDPATGEADDGGVLLSAESVGATLLALADIDPGEWVTGAEPVTGVIR